MIKMAHTVKLRSQDVFRQVGAVCSSAGNLILSCGYNGLVSGFEPPEGFYDGRENPIRELLTNHAEQNALSLCKRGEVHTISITCSPCQYCSKLIAGFGIKRVLYSEEYDREDHFKKIFDFYNIEYKLLTEDGRESLE
jgi:deoxycytidylate deaminase